MSTYGASGEAVSKFACPVNAEPPCICVLLLVWFQNDHWHFGDVRSVRNARYLYKYSWQVFSVQSSGRFQNGILWQVDFLPWRYENNSLHWTLRTKEVKRKRRIFASCIPLYKPHKSLLLRHPFYPSSSTSPTQSNSGIDEMGPDRTDVVPPCVNLVVSAT